MYGEEESWKKLTNSGSHGSIAVKPACVCDAVPDANK